MNEIEIVEHLLEKFEHLLENEKLAPDTALGIALCCGITKFTIKELKDGKENVN